MAQPTSHGDAMSMVSQSQLRAEIASAKGIDESATAAVQARVDGILRPAGALTKFDELAVWLAGWQRTTTPAVVNPVAIIFAGDHGVAREGVSAYPAEVTGAMFAAFQQKKASVSAIASVSGTTVHAIDVGVGQPTGNIRIEPAMSEARFAQSFTAGRKAVATLWHDHGKSPSGADIVGASGPDLLIFGEMGIGNTTVAAAIAAALANGPAAAPYSDFDIARFVGRGTGVNDEQYRNKVRIVAEALARYFSLTDADDRRPRPLTVLQQLGGTELAAIAGAMLEARLRSVPVLLDGYIASVPAGVLHAIDPTLIANMRAAHRSTEPGHHLLLERLGLTPLLDLEMRLGEASGAVAAVPLLQMACKLVTDVPTFDEWFGGPE